MSLSTGESAKATRSSPRSTNFTPPGLFATQNKTTKMTDFSSKVVVCIGAGYVGGPTMAVMAKHCEEVEFHVVDINAQRIKEWNSDNLPIYEPGLNNLIKHVCFFCFCFCFVFCFVFVLFFVFFLSLR